MAEGTPLDLCDRVLGAVGSRADAVVTAWEGSSGLTRFAGSHIHQNLAEEIAEVALRVTVDGGRTASVSSTQLDDEGIGRLVESALAAASVRPADPGWPGLAPLAATSGDQLWDDATAAATPTERAAVVRALVDAAGGLETAGFCSTSGRRSALANSAGQRIEGRSTTAAVDGVARTGVSDGLGHRLSVRLADLDGAAAGAVAAQKAEAGRTAVDIEPGHYEVVLEPRAVAEVLLFLAYYGFSAKALADGRSFVRLGDTQFDAAVDLVDDCHDPATSGWLHDVEGTPRRRVGLVEAGVTSAVVHDRRTAAAAGVESTGHGTGSDTIGPVPQNLRLGTSGATASPAALVAGVERGLLVTDFWYNRILDPKTQVVTGLTRNGLFLVEGGEVVGAVTNLRYTQSFVGALGPGKVLGVGDDAQLVNGFVVPSLRLADWHFSGGAKG